MKIVDNPYKKEFVFDLYSRIYPDFKNYDKITKKKMIEKIREFYSNYNNISNINHIVFISKDGKFWEEVYESLNFSDIDVIGDTLIAKVYSIDDKKSGVCYLSDNGEWIEFQMPEELESDDILQIIYNETDNQYIAVANGYSLVSDDFSTWTRFDGGIEVSDSIGYVYEPIYGENGYLLVYQIYNENYDYVMSYSTDGITWENVSENNQLLSGYRVVDCAYGNGEFIMIVHDKESIDIFYYLSSSDGVNWTEPALIEGISDINGLEYANGLFFISLIESVHTFRSSEDMKEQEFSIIRPSSLLGYSTIKFANDRLVMFCRTDGSIRSSMFRSGTAYF